MVSMNVTLLISFSVVMPSRTLSSADSRRKRHAFFARRALDFRSRPLVQNHLADAVAQIQQFVDRRPAAESGAAAFDAARAFVERQLAPFVRDRGRWLPALRIRIVHRRLAVIRRSGAPAAAPECSSARKRSCTARRPCSGSGRARRRTLLAWTVVNTRWPVSAD